MAIGDKRCKHCGALVREINYALGPKWMHVNHSSSFPTTSNNGLWEYCQLRVAEPEDEVNES